MQILRDISVRFCTKIVENFVMIYLDITFLFEKLSLGDFYDLRWWWSKMGISLLFHEFVVLCGAPRVSACSLNYFKTAL
jgi:hypothetical protein